MVVAAIYARISKSDDKYAKVEEQVVDCLAFAAELGYTVPDDAVFRDDGVSATKGKRRAGFEALVEQMATGRFDVLLAKEQSRFERSPLDWNLLAVATVAGGATWRTIAEGVIDPAEGDSEFMSLIRSGMNREESRRNRKRVIARNARTIREGRPIVTKRPFGYEPDGVTPRDEEAALVRYAVEKIIEGATLGSIVRHFQDSGITPVVSRKELELAAADGRAPKAARWSSTVIVGIVKRPRNVGDIMHRGEVVGSGITPIVDRARWEAAVAVLTAPERSVTRSRALTWMMSGAATCGTCGARMRPSSVNGHPVYRCGSPRLAGERHPMIMTHLLDDVVEQAVASHYLSANRRDEPEAVSAVAVQKQLADVRERKARAAEQALTPGFEATFARLAAELNSEEERLRAELDGIARSNAAILLELESRRALWTALDGRVSLEDAATAHADIVARFREFPVEERRAIVRSLFRVTVGMGSGVGRVKIEPHDA